MPKKGPLSRDMTLTSLNTADRVRTLERLRDRPPNKSTSSNPPATWLC